jgi:hypothetical protein
MRYGEARSVEYAGHIRPVADPDKSLCPETELLPACPEAEPAILAVVKLNVKLAQVEDVLNGARDVGGGDPWCFGVLYLNKRVEP